MQRLAWLVTCTSLLAPACSGDDDSAEPVDSAPTLADEQVLADAIADQAVANPDNPLDESATRCIAEEAVVEFGAEELAEVGVTVDDPDLDLGRVLDTRDQAERAFDLALDCIEFDRELLAFLPAGLEVGEETIDCLAEGLETESFRELYVSFVLGELDSDRVVEDPAARPAILELVTGCLDVDELLDFGQLEG